MKSAAEKWLVFNGYQWPDNFDCVAVGHIWEVRPDGSKTLRSVHDVMDIYAASLLVDEGWTSCEEKYPEKNGLYLVNFSYVRIDIYWYQAIGDDRERRKNEWKDNHVTHWRPSLRVGRGVHQTDRTRWPQAYRHENAH